ncbi:MAG: enoyl-CoA hydratase-related protein [Bacteroidota bacterium]
MSVLKTHNTLGTLLVTISRPDALNALNTEVLDGLRKIIQETYQNHDIKGVILTGEGEKAFAAGADIKELTRLNQQEALFFAQKGQKLFKMIEDCPKPVIAAINGFALGGGCELAMACHMRLATENAKFGQPEVNLGIIPGYGGTQRLTQLIGRGKSLELMLTGDMITAQEAKAWGLVNHVVSTQSELMELANKIMSKILSKGPIAVAHVIKAVNAGFEFEQAGYEAESKYFSECSITQDFKEGTTAFIEKRKPVFKGV